MKRIVWTAQARADIRGLDKPTAMRLLSGLHHFADTGTGDVKALQGDAEALRLRVGDYRILFAPAPGDTLEILRVRHRREAYR